MKAIITSVFILLFSAAMHSQVGMSIPAAREKGITIQNLDSVYKSAIHSEADKAVFKTEEEQEKLINAYRDFLIDFGDYLLKNNFKWAETTKGWNRIYMQPDGTIDYFLYDLKNIAPAKQQEFNRLLNRYIKSHKFGITAPVKFAQCSPVTYPKSE